MKNIIEKICICAVVICLFTVGYFLVSCFQNKILTEELGAKISNDVAGNGAWEKDLQDAARSSSKSRQQGYSFVSYEQTLKVGDYVDVRISFPNGSDFVVLVKKKIEEFFYDGIVLIVTEDDILKMASAKVDMDQFQGCMVYASKYVDEEDSESISNYPVRKDVLLLYGWDPNVKMSSLEKDYILNFASKRNELENALNNILVN